MSQIVVLLVGLILSVTLGLVAQVAVGICRAIVQSVGMGRRSTYRSNPKLRARERARRRARAAQKRVLKHPHRGARLTLARLLRRAALCRGYRHLRALKKSAKVVGRSMKERRTLNLAAKKAALVFWAQAQEVNELVREYRLKTSLRRRGTGANAVPRLRRHVQEDPTALPVSRSADRLLRAKKAREHNLQQEEQAQRRAAARLTVIEIERAKKARLILANPTLIVEEAKSVLLNKRGMRRSLRFVGATYRAEVAWGMATPGLRTQAYGRARARLAKVAAMKEAA